MKKIVTEKKIRGRRRRCQVMLCPRALRRKRMKTRRCDFKHEAERVMPDDD